MNFEELGLKPEILRAITDLGFTSPTPIQEKAIPMIIGGNTDMVGLAQTGTGKTAAFGLPLLNLVDFNQKGTQALVICPTRELCNQITSDLAALSKYLGNSNIVAVYGGASIENQARQVRRGAQIVVATPGRLMDLMERKLVDISTIKYVVLDEADEMLNMGFQEDIDHILSFTPAEKHVWLFSATMPANVARIARKYLNEPVDVTIGKQNASAENIDHVYYTVREKDRYFALKRVIDFNPEIFGIIFCRTRNETQAIAEHLMKDGYNCEPIHGDLSQQQRDAVMKKFKERTLQLLCATDVAARGIDVNNITHVINYNLPDDSENYTHRSGRTARAGKSGESIAFITPRELGRIKDIERQIKTKFRHLRIPNGSEICEKQLLALIEKVAKVEINENAIGQYLPQVNAMLESMTKEEVIKHFVSAEFNRFLNYYKNAEDLNASVSSRTDTRASQQSEGGIGFTRFFINMGEMDHINKGTLVRVICERAGINSKDIGRIDIKREFSFIEVSTNVSDNVVSSMEGADIDGRPVNMEISKQTPREFGSGGGDRGGYGGGDRGGDRGGYKKRSFGGSGGGYSGGGDRGGDRGGYGGGGGGYKKPSYGGGGDRDRNDRGGDRGRKKEYSSGGGKKFGGNSGGSGSGSSSSGEKRPRNFYKPE